VTAPSRANRPWGPKRPRMGVGELSGYRIGRSPERPTQGQTVKLNDGQRLVHSNFFGLDTPFPASSATRPAQRIVLAWIYAGNHDGSSIAVRENHTILDPLAPSERHTVQFCDCGQRWKCGWRHAPPPRGLFSQGRVRGDEVLTGWVSGPRWTRQGRAEVSRGRSGVVMEDHLFIVPPMHRAS